MEIKILYCKKNIVLYHIQVYNTPPLKNQPTKQTKSMKWKIKWKHQPNEDLLNRLCYEPVCLKEGIWQDASQYTCMGVVVGDINSENTAMFEEGGCMHAPTLLDNFAYAMH